MQDKIKKQQQQYLEDLIKEVHDDFETRRNERRSFETQWRLNNNFLIGNQYCGITLNNNIEDFQKQYFWQ